tara:strand:+ start:960 stop:1193 length:234 start_codon:yes stop_codon:yes gene_type:complete
MSKAKEKTAENQLKDLIITYKKVFSNDDGSKVLEDLSKRCHLKTTTNVKGDSHESAFLEGQRAAFLFIINMIERPIE